MMNWKSIVILIVLLSTVIASSVGYGIRKSKERYKQDIQYLDEIAGKLGYTQQDYLNFHHSYTFGIDAYYDHLQLLFATQKSLEEFSTLVDGLGVSARGSRKSSSHIKDYGFLYIGELKKNLDLLSRRPEMDTDRKHPYVTTWLLIDKSLNRPIMVRYADAGGEENIWRYSGRLFESAVVEIDIDRLGV